MAYNYFNSYTPYYQNQLLQYPQQLQNPNIMQNMNNQQGNFISVHNEQEARNYPVALNTSVTFIDESAPFCYVKTMGANQFDRPRFDRYRLVKEDDETTAQMATENKNRYAKEEEITALWEEIDNLKNIINVLRKESVVSESVNTENRKQPKHNANVSAVQTVTD